MLAPCQIDGLARLLVVLDELLEFVLQHLLGDHVEHFVDVDVVLGGRLKQLDIHLSGEPLGVLRDDDFAVRVIVFVTNCGRGVERGYGFF